MSATNNNQKTLTKEQQEFSARHHDLVLKFLRRKRLPMDEYYDVVIFGYLSAVQVYDTRPDLREKHSFEAIAITKMRDKLYEYWRYLNRTKRKGIVKGLQEPYHGTVLEEGVAAEMTPVEDAVELVDAWEKVAPHLTQLQMETLLMKSRGYTYDEIASAYNIKRGSVHTRMFRIRSKARACLAI